MAAVEDSENPKRERLTLEHPPTLKPEDWARFIELKAFTRGWKRLKLDDDDLRALWLLIMIQGSDAPVVSGTGGLRKIRFSSSRWGTGKKGGARVCFAYFVEFSVVLLVTVYRKGKKEDLTEKEKREIKELLKGFEDDLRKGKINV